MKFDKLKNLKPKKKEKQQKNQEDDEKLSLKEMFGFKDKNKDNKITEHGLLAKFPGGRGYVPLGAWQYNRQYSDSLGPHFTVIVDEAAELLQTEGGRSAEAKEQAAFRDEIETCLKSITQLGRSAGIAAVIATQRNDASLIPGVIQNNCLNVNTKIEVLRPVDIDVNKDYDKIINKDHLQNLADKLGVEYNNGIVFKDEVDKERFYQNMKHDAELYDKEHIKENKSTSIMQNMLDEKKTIKI